MIFLDELFEANDFSAAARRLAADFRREQGLGEVHQLGLVVADVEAAAASLEQRGLGPFFIAGGNPVRWQERGQEKRFNGKLGIAYHRGLELELLEPGSGSDFYRQSLDPGGRVVVQHLGLLVPEVDGPVAKLESAGYPAWVRGAIKSGPLVTEFAYMDTASEAGFVIEFICMRLFGRLFSPPPGLIHALGRLEKLLGKRSFSI